MIPRLAALLVIVAAAACSGNQSVFNPAGPQARTIAHLGWWFLSVCAAVYLVVISALGWTLMRRRRVADDGAGSDRTLVVAVGSGVAITTLIVVGLAIASVAADRGLETSPGPTSVDVDVIGHQWWWEFKYTNDEHPDQLVDSPNELHLPVGVRVHIRAMSHDVIHSFWVPNLRGKRDLIPGTVSETWIEADRPGEYHGQCAEFCGELHGKMAFIVVAEPMDAFQQWLHAQQAPAADPSTDLAVHGRDVFMGGPCIMCHTIRGTSAGATAGPELTHLAGRRYIGARTLPTTPENLARWILDAHVVKPGTQMPPNPLSADDLKAVVAYISTLK